MDFLESIKNALTNIISFIFFLSVFSFVTGFVIGNFYGAVKTDKIEWYNIIGKTLNK